MGSLFSKKSPTRRSRSGSGRGETAQDGSATLPQEPEPEPDIRERRDIGAGARPVTVSLSNSPGDGLSLSPRTRPIIDINQDIKNGVDILLHTMEDCCSTEDVNKIHDSLDSILDVLQGFVQDLSATKADQTVQSFVYQHGTRKTKRFIDMLQVISSAAEHPDEFTVTISTRGYLYLVLGLLAMYSHRGLQGEIVEQEMASVVAKDLEMYYTEWKENTRLHVALDKLMLVVSGGLVIIDSCARVEKLRAPLKQQVHTAVSYFVDPKENHTNHVIYAVSILERIDPKNTTHKYLFPPFFFTELVKSLNAVQYDNDKGSFMVFGDDQTIPDMRNFVFMELTSLLSCFVVLIRSNSYKCQCLQKMHAVKDKTERKLDDIFTRGSDLEKSQMKIIMSDLIKHSCTKCKWDYLGNVFLKHGVKFDLGTLRKLPVFGEQLLDPAEMDETGQFKCKYMNMCQQYLNTLDDGTGDGAIEDYLDPEHHRCFCEVCMDERKDLPVYERGNPPRKYALPRGWAKFALRVPPRAIPQKMFQNWHLGFHGTKSENVKSILEVGDFLMPGDYAPGGSGISIPVGHYDDATAPSGHDIRQFFVTPSILYAGYTVYSPHKQFDLGGKRMYGKVAFQVRIKPKCYKVGPETVGLTAKGKVIDPNFKNEELEWMTKQRGVIVLVGLLIKIDSKK